MYEVYWQLEQKPFENVADPRFYYPGESQQAALLKLRYVVESRHGGTLLAGPCGCGKTLLLRLLQQTLGKDYSPLVHLVFPQMSSVELLAYMAAELTGADLSAGCPSVPESAMRIEHFLGANSRGGKHAVMVIDEAHLLHDAQTFESLRLLLNFESEGRPGLTLILAGQTGLLPVLERMPQWEERLAVKCLLRPFVERETAAYVEHRLKIAGARQPIFEPAALATLHQLTHGIARRINRLCDLALLIGYAEGRRTIDSEQLESVSNELLAIAPE
jgi:general secretion pathway protein A